MNMPLGPRPRLALCGIDSCVGHCAVCNQRYDAPLSVNGAGVPKARLSNKGTGAAMHRERYKLNARRQTAIAQAFKRAGLDWQTDLANAIKNADAHSLTPNERNRAKERISLWLKLLPYLVTGGRASPVGSGRQRKGKASKAALKALEALEGKVI